MKEAQFHLWMLSALPGNNRINVCQEKESGYSYNYMLGCCYITYYKRCIIYLPASFLVKVGFIL